MSAAPCPVCGIVWGHRQRCESRSCPVYGMVPGTAEADAAAETWRSRGARTLPGTARTMTGDDALAAMERRTWLDLAGVAVAYGIEHEAGP